MPEKCSNLKHSYWHINFPVPQKATFDKAVKQFCLLCELMSPPPVIKKAFYCIPSQGTGKCPPKAVTSSLSDL